MITDKARKIQKYKAICTDATYAVRTRIAAARRLLRISDHPDGSHTDGCTRVAKRIAKKFLKDPAISAKDRSSALRLWEIIMDAPTLPDDNLDDNTEDLAILRAESEPLKPAPIVVQQPQSPPPNAAFIGTKKNGQKVYLDKDRNELGPILTEGVPNVEPKPVFSKDL